VRHRFLAVGWLVVCLASHLSGGVSIASAQAPADDPDALLKLPVTPASVALLVNQITNPRAQERLRAALADARPEVRLVAGRVAFVGHIGPLRSALLDALDQEADPRAGVEELRAAVDLGEPADDARILAAARHLGPPALRAWLLSLGRIRPADALAQFPGLATLFTPASSAGTLLAPIVVRDPPLTDRVLDLLAAPRDDLDAGSVTAFFEALDFSDPASATIMGRALRSSGNRVRIEPIWHVATLLAWGQTVDPGTLSVIASTPARPGSEEAFARDLLARVVKQSTSSTDWVPLLRDQTWHVPDALQGWLTKEEFAALTPGFRQKTQPKKTQPVSQKSASAGVPWTRSLSALSAGLIDELMTLTGCTGRGALEKSGAEVRYTESGRPKSIGIAANHPSPACDLVMRTAAKLTIARDAEAQPARTIDTVLFAMTPGLLACASAAPFAPVASPMGSDKQIVTPTVRREVQPDYPKGARTRRVQGTPWVRAVVTAQGCVSEMDIARRVDPELDIAALYAVSRWLFDPARRDGQALPVEVVVEVSFTIKQ
jgi:TonB family protein